MQNIKYTKNKPPDTGYLSQRAWYKPVTHTLQTHVPIKSWPGGENRVVSFLFLLQQTKKRLFVFVFKYIDNKASLVLLGVMKIWLANVHKLGMK